MLNKMKKFDWKVTIRVNILTLKIVGLWPEGDDAYKPNLYSLYAIMSMILFTIVHNLLQTINLFFIFDDLQAVTATIFVSLGQMISILKYYCVIQNMETLKQLMITLNSDMFQPKNFKQRSLVKPNLNFWKTVFAILWGNAGCTLFLWAAFPILDKSYKEFRLPFLSWYPYDTKSSPFYEMTYIYQVISSYFICAVNIGVDTLIAALNMYIAAQCDILCDDLKNVHNATEIENVSHDMNINLLKCIKHHKEILSFAENSNKFFNWIVLLQFLTSAISIGLTMFQLTVIVPLTSEFYSFLFYLNCVVVQIFMYCWFGNEVEVKSTQIPYAVFECDWTNAPLEVKRNIIFFILQSQKPIKMSAMNLFYLSLNTFMMILRSSWSYFAVLNQVNSRK